MAAASAFHPSCLTAALIRLQVSRKETNVTTATIAKSKNRLPRQERQLTVTEMYWHDDTAIQSMADYLRFYNPSAATPARWAQPFLDHARPIPFEIRGKLITNAINAGWTWNWRTA
jgi:hypothetical protein